MKTKACSAADARYIAGLFDGEGTIALYELKGGSRRKLYNPTVSFSIGITNTHRPVILFVKRVIGGQINIWYPQKRTKDGRRRKTTYHWYATRIDSARILRTLLPFLIVKKRQAKLAVTFHDWFQKTRHHTHKGSSLSAFEIRKRRSYVTQMKRLKHQD